MSGLSKDLLAEVRYNGKLMKVVDVVNAIDSLNSGVFLTTSEAAIFLRTSVTKLERLRKEGGGPPYSQGGGTGAKGTNQSCLYEKEDLLAWVRGNKVSSSREAAIRKGQAFVTIHDLAELQPFYLDKNGAIESLVEENSLGTVVERIGSWSVIWLSAVEAASRMWSELSAHQAFAASVASVLSTCQQSVASGLAATDIASVTQEGKGGRRGAED